jgi:cold shock CspA family protein
MIGLIRAYKPEHGYGFLVSQQKQTYFHISEWQEEADPCPQDRVEFSLKPSKRNGYPDEAAQIRRIETNAQPLSPETSGGSAMEMLAGKQVVGEVE